MAKKGIDFTRDGLDKIINSPGVQGDIRRRTKAVADASGRGYKYEVDYSGTRPRGRIWPTRRSSTPGNDAAQEIIRNLDAGR